MAVRAGIVDATGEYRDCVPTRRQSGAKRGSFDPICSVSHNHAPSAGEVGSEVPGDVLLIRK